MFLAIVTRPDIAYAVGVLSQVLDKPQQIHWTMNMEKESIVEKMNKDLHDFVANLPRKEYLDGWSENNWRKEIEEHPLFRTKPLGEDEEMPALFEALQQLKYDPSENTPEELAMAYKEDGNTTFKAKKYRWAVDSYTKGIEAKCENNELNAQLYANRATSHYHIGNYEKALKDAIESKKFKPDHLKAYQRGAMCCFQLKEFDDCISWCDEGLQVAPEDKNLMEMKKKSVEEKRIIEQNKKSSRAQEVKKKKDLKMLKRAMKARGIVLADENFENSIVHPTLQYAQVHLKAGRLVWPVLFMYPEYGTTDYIHEFHEDASLLDHLNIMFKPDEPPEWDSKHEYIVENLQVYFSDVLCIIPVKKTKTLAQILRHKRFKVTQGTPCLIVTVRGSKFDEFYRKKNIVLEE
ncbi:tetratricopeptide repeat protein 4 homolog [Trichonephila clavata]|uniref:Tetratricopeptide repeat protein 4 homolog n=2 Tax=Trichonephila clavata TaxID=2740835 RepID=A0A8X6HQW5_TRICU|nr:tetratricopeptide repeat protein 4 homolog [Trichonephila clavata]